jgi:hypothetical protein
MDYELCPVVGRTGDLIDSTRFRAAAGWSVIDRKLLLDPREIRGSFPANQRLDLQ